MELAPPRYRQDGVPRPVQNWTRPLRFLVPPHLIQMARLSLFETSKPFCIGQYNSPTNSSSIILSSISDMHDARGHSVAKTLERKRSPVLPVFFPGQAFDAPRFAAEYAVDHAFADICGGVISA